MNFFWVNVKKTVNEIIATNQLWVPLKVELKNGTQRDNAGWNTLNSAKPGDILFCNVNQRIVGVGVATHEPNSDTPIPKTRKKAKTNPGIIGKGLKIKYINLTNPLPIKEFKDQLIRIFNQDCEPLLFNSNGNLSQNYMSQLPPGAGMLITHSLRDYVQEIDEISQSSTDNVSEGRNTTRQQQARVGQEKFRKSVLKYWRNRCAVTGIDDPKLLIASHIIPWSLSSGKQKTDPHNGICLSPDLDRLFDIGYISFTDEGHLITHPKIKITHSLTAMGIKKNSQIKQLKQGHVEYLRRHREIFNF